jgi:integrase
MPKISDTAFPSYRLHKQSGQAIVTLSGRDFLLGPHGSPDSKQKYRRLTAEWDHNGRRLPESPKDIAIVEVMAAFWRHAETYYRHPDGSPTNEIRNIRDAIGLLKRLYGSSPVQDFGPLALKTVRGEMIRLGWCRGVVNNQIGRIKHLFKWAVENELVPPAVFQALSAVAGLRAGRSDARESEPVKPVPLVYVDATMPYVAAQVQAMVRLQLATAMRPGEVVLMRGVDIDMSGKLWTYRPPTHKTLHHGHERVIYMGPKAQEIIRPFLKHDLSAYLFNPQEAEACRHAKAETHRRPDQKPSIKHTNRRLRERYDVNAYRRCITRACDRANLWAKAGVVVDNDERIIPRWHPHQLRHTAATELRKNFGLEAAQVVLGHRTLTVTQVYAEKNVEAAQRIMGEVG